MQDIKFETDRSFDINLSRNTVSTKGGFILKLLAKLGISDTVTTNYILFGMAVILIGITIFMYAGILKDPTIDRVAEARAILIMQNSI